MSERLRIRAAIETAQADVDRLTKELSCLPTSHPDYQVVSVAVARANDRIRESHRYMASLREQSLTPALDDALDDLEAQKSETQAALAQARADVADAEQRFETNETDANWRAVEAARSKRDRFETSLANVAKKLEAVSADRESEQKQRAREEREKALVASRPLVLIDADADELANLLEQVFDIEARMAERARVHVEHVKRANAMLGIFDAHAYRSGALTVAMTESQFVETLHSRANEIARSRREPKKEVA
jgi:hypothetical protein